MRKITIDKEHLSAAMWVTIASFIVIVLLHSIARIPERYSLIGTSLHIVSAYFGIKFLLKTSDLTFVQCRINSPRFSFFGVFIVLFYALGYCFALTVVPGRFIWSNLPLEQVYTNLKIAYFHSVAIPIAEELIFRGVIFKAYERCFGKVISVFATSIVFTLGHIGNSIPREYLYWNLTLVFAIGICLLLLTLNSNNIWDSVLLHSMGNFCAHGILVETNNQINKGFFTYLTDVEPTMEGAVLSFIRLIIVTSIIGAIILIKMYLQSKKAQTPVLDD